MLHLPVMNALSGRKQATRLLNLEEFSVLNLNKSLIYKCLLRAWISNDIEIISDLFC